MIKANVVKQEGMRMAQPTPSQRVLVLGASTELGQEIVRQLVARGHGVTGTVTSERHTAVLRAMGSTPFVITTLTAATLAELYAQQPAVVLNLIPQRANTLLHDGHKWRNFAEPLQAASTALVGAAAQGAAPRVVTTSYTFLYHTAQDAKEDAPLYAPAGDPIFAAAIEAEQAIFSDIPSATVVRLGYLYGPQSNDLRLYVKAFARHRPYFAGLPTHRADWLHLSDAAAALVRLTEQAPRARSYNIVADVPSSFTEFMDHFAHLLGVRHPLHIPRWGWRLARAIITQEQMELLRLSTTATSARFRAEYGWQPQFPDYHMGLAEVLHAWGKPIAKR
jgi:nucleoside-diphosphate-sugar epimerase